MGLEPIWISPFDFKSNAYTNSAIRAWLYYSTINRVLLYFITFTSNSFYPVIELKQDSNLIIVYRAQAWWNNEK